MPKETTTLTEAELVSKDPRWTSAGAIVVAIVVAKFLLQMVTAQNYGYFRDELYFVQCSKHLAWGYVEFPPFTVVVAWLSRVLLGVSLVALRFFPAVAGAIKVLFAGLIARAGWRPIRSRVGRVGGGGGARLPRGRSPADHERVRAGLLDRMRIRSDSSHSRQPSQVVDIVRSSGWIRL